MMKVFEILKSSLSTLKANGRRTFLTMIGIIIGIAAVITILSIGRGFKAETTESLTKDVKGRTSQMFYYNPMGALSEEDYMRLKPFSQANLDHISDIQGVDEATDKIDEADVMRQTEVKVGKEPVYFNYSLSEGTNYHMLAGRNLTKVDSDNKKRVVIISDMTMAMLQYQTPEEAIHKTLVIEGSTFTIVGVYMSPTPEEANTNSMMFGMPMESGAHVSQGGYERDMSNAFPSYSLTVYFEAGTIAADMKLISKQIKNYLDENGSGKDSGVYDYYDQSEMMEEMSRTLDQVTLFISAVAAISLFIAGVGVMNMMYISVSERTKEIGIRRSIGATGSSIQTQFLLEGIVITTTGGIIGYLLGIGIAVIVGNMINLKPMFEIGPAMMSAIVSMGIGIIFSVFPARSAAKKNVVEILR